MVFSLLIFKQFLKGMNLTYSSFIKTYMGQYDLGKFLFFALYIALMIFIMLVAPFVVYFEIKKLFR